MTLTDGDVAVLARQAVDLLDARRSFGIYLDSGTTQVGALAHLLDQTGVIEDAVVLTCPDTGAEVGRSRPDAT